jgi:hypothetical protein
MIKDIVLQHQLEKERLLSKDYIPREKLDFAKKFLKTDLFICLCFLILHSIIIIVCKVRIFCILINKNYA